MLKSDPVAPQFQPIPDFVVRERRRSPRLEALGTLHGQLVPLRIAIRTLEIGFGGFSIETVFPMPVGAEQDFRFTLRNGSTVNVRGRVVHCRREDSGRKPVFVIGLEFTDGLPARRRNAKALVREVETAQR
jgi:hypothetical protein